MPQPHCAPQRQSAPQVHPSPQPQLAPQSHAGTVPGGLPAFGRPQPQVPEQLQLQGRALWFGSVMAIS